MLSANEEAKLISQASGVILPVGAANTTPFAQTFDRRFCNGAALTPATGVMNLTGIWLPDGSVVNGITMVKIGGPTSSTHLWM